MKKIGTTGWNRKQILKQTKLTIGMDLADRFTHYCVLDQAGEVLFEDKLPTTKQGMQHVFGKIPRSRIAMETGAHSPWVSRQLTQLGHEVIVAHAQKVRLIGESSRKDDRVDARMLARLARLDPREDSKFPPVGARRKLSADTANCLKFRVWKACVSYCRCAEEVPAFRWAMILRAFS